MNASQLVLVAEDSNDDYESTLRALNHDEHLANPVARRVD